MKKLTAVLLAVMVLVGSAVPALAAIDMGTVPLIESPLGKAGCVVEEDGWEYVQTFIVSTLTAQQRTVYDKFIALPDNRKMLFSDYSKNTLTLVVPKSDAKIMGSPSAGYTIQTSCFMNFSYSGGRLTVLSAYPSEGNLSIQSYSGSSSPYIGYLVIGRDFAQDIVNGTSPNPNANFLKHYQTWTKGIAWRDDIEDEPSEPEPPTPSEPEPEPIPPWNPGKAPPPTSPGANKSPYVPYDVSVWDDFIAYLRTASGSATNIIMLIMIPFIIVPLVISILKHFASGGKGGGGGKTV